MLAALVRMGTAVDAVRVVDRLWYNPNPGSLDLRRMFEHPEEWEHTRRGVDVFQFTMQHTYAVPDAVVGPNSYDALVRAGAFRRLEEWRIRTGVGVGAVKEFYCTPDARGMQTAVSDTVAAVRAVRDAGGAVHYLAMDEPFLSGQSSRCGGPALEPTADRLAIYFAGVKRAYPLSRIGLVEAYPSFSADQFAEMLRLMKSRGIAPAFLHVDVDLNSVDPRRGHDFPRDMQRIAAAARAERIPFGIMIWGYNGDADALFARDAVRLVRAFQQAFPNPDSLPDQVIFASWSESSTGLRITPANLPEDRPYTLTNLMWQEYRRLLGDTGGTTGFARPR